jgi:hypothetical protein
MKLKRSILLVALATVASAAFAQNLFSNQSASVNQVALFSSSTALNGSAAPAGGFYSELQTDGAPAPNTIANTSAGFSVHTIGPTGTNFRLADDFAVTGPGWNVTGVKVYAYATGTALATNWLTGGNLRIWNGRPGESTSSVIFDSGALTSSQIGHSNTFTTNAGTGNHYRIFNSSPGTSAPGSTRSIREFTFNLNLNLGAGTYWIDYQLERLVGTTYSTVFNPSTTHQGVRGVAGANALQFNGTAWVSAIDAGIIVPANTTPAAGSADVAQEIPFVLTGQPVPEPMTMAVLALGALAARRKKNKKA